MKLNLKETLKKVLLLFAGFVLTYALLRFIIYLADAMGKPRIYYAGTAVYGLAVVALFAVFYVLNGFTLGHTEYERDDLPDAWTDEFLRDLPANRAKARSLMYILMPLIVTLLLSYIELSFFR